MRGCQVCNNDRDNAGMETTSFVLSRPVEKEELDRMQSAVMRVEGVVETDMDAASNRLFVDYRSEGTDMNRLEAVMMPWIE